MPSFFMVHPEYTILSQENEEPIDKHLTAFYASTEGLKQQVLRKLIQQAFQLIATERASEALDIPLGLQSNISFLEVLQLIHYPQGNLY